MVLHIFPAKMGEWQRVCGLMGTAGQGKLIMQEMGECGNNSPEC